MPVKKRKFLAKHASNCAAQVQCLRWLLTKLVLQVRVSEKPTTSPTTTAATIIAATMLVAAVLIGGSSGESLHEFLSYPCFAALPLLLLPLSPFLFAV
jgi:hypothetical protein